jgi:hypothetical protein
VRRPRALIALVLALVTLTLVLTACGGGDDEEATTEPAPSEDPSGGDTSPSPSALPPELLECFAKRGYTIESPAEIHSAPPEVVQRCFGALHQGGAAP